MTIAMEIQVGKNQIKEKIEKSFLLFSILFFSFAEFKKFVQFTIHVIKRYVEAFA